MQINNKKRVNSFVNSFSLAVRTRLELATPCVTGMYSNQLNYRTSVFDFEIGCKGTAIF